MPRGRNSSAAALVIARTPNAPADQRPRPGIARRAEPPVTCTRVAGRPCAITNRPLADKNENAARAGAAAHESKPSRSARAIGPPPKGPERSPPYAPAALTPSRVLCVRATPVTAQPSVTSSSMTARPKLRAPNTTALLCLACVSFIGSLDSVGVLVRSGNEDDLPRHVTGLELGERCSNVVERVGALNRHDEVARRYRLGQFGEGRRARRGRAAFELDAVLLGRGEVDDRVDPVLGDAELERQLDVAVPDEVDERGHRRLLGGVGDALTDAVAVGNGKRAALAQPGVMALAGQCDHARAVWTESWTANTPTPPPAPAITTASPAVGATARTVANPVTPATNSPPATAHGTSGGFAVRLAASTTTYSAWLARLSV